MTCATCGSKAARMRIVKGRETCAKCGGFSEAGGGRTDGVLSRQRTRDQGVKYEGDTINPWAYSKAEKAFVPNDDFIKLHGGKAYNFFKPEDLKAYPKLAEKIKGGFTERKSEVEGTGDELAAQMEVIADK